MSHWLVSVYSSTTDELLRELPVRNVDVREIRHQWDVPWPAPIPPLRVEPQHLHYLAQHLVEPLSLKADEEAFLEEYQDFDGEVVDH